MNLREFYETLNEDGKRYLIRSCSDWFDANEPDCYLKFKPVIKSYKDSSIVLESLQSKSASSRSYYYYGDSDKYRDLLKYVLSTWCCMRDEGLFDDDALMLRIKSYLITDAGSSCLWMMTACNKKENRVKLMEAYDEAHNDGYMPLYHLLFKVNDYSKVCEEIDYKSQINFTGIGENEMRSMIDIFGIEIMNHFAAVDPIDFAGAMRVLTNEIEHNPSKKESMGPTLDKMRDVFDEKFFLPDGWTDEEKLSVVIKRFGNEYSDVAVRRFEEFAKEILSVDPRWYRAIGSLVAQCPALGNKIYEAKKPDDEIDETTPVDMTFRYSKTIRKIGKIANVCARESLSKANGSFLKEVGALIRLYGYDFNMIYDCMFPEVDDNAA